MLNLLAQSSSYYTTTDDSMSAGFLAIMGIFYLIYFAVLIFIIVAEWKIYTKAGKPGWASIVPIYSSIVSMEIIGRPGWWFLLYMIPLFGLYVMVLDSILLARSFGKDTGFGIGLLFLPIIFYPILAFGSSQYQGPTANGTSLSI
jgi:hypothetical protein